MTTHDEMMSLHEEMGIGLLVISRLYRRELDNALKKYGLSEAAALPLRFLARVDKPLKQKELADYLNVETPTLVKVLTLLEERGLVLRHALDGDKRVRLVSLSAEGKALNDKLHVDLAYIRMNLFNGMEEDDMTTFIRTLKRIDHNLRHIER